MNISPYRDLFVSEAREHLGALNSLIVRLEEVVNDKSAIDELFRHAHSLKGMAATMGYDSIADLAHNMEDQLSRVRSGEAPFISSLADLMLEASDELASMVFQVESESETITDASDLVARLSLFDPAAEKCSTLEHPQKNEKVTTESPLSASPPTHHQFRQTDSFKSIRIKTETLDQLVNIAGELITNRCQLAECARLTGLSDFDQPLNQLSGLLRDLRDVVFKARMVPFAFIAESFPRLVRDLARKQGKEITFDLDGKNIELDRDILEEIAEPLVHILRNAVDHGLESPQERAAAGKPESGNISLTVAHDKDHIEIVITDDGRGMDPELLKLKAVEKGLLTVEHAQAMPLEELLMLACSPGFSTANNISQISGRGVGMDAVLNVVRSLGGLLTINSEVGCGSRIMLCLPITVSTIQALLVQSGNLEIAFPISAVSRTLEIKREEVIIEAEQETIDLDGVRVPVRNLNRILGQPVTAGSAGTLLPAVLCETNGVPVVFIADRLSGQHEIFVKPLGSPLSLLQGLSSATIAGDGRVVFVADAAFLA